MIELIVEEYCQECPEFSPDIGKDIARAWDNRIYDRNSGGFT